MVVRNKVDKQEPKEAGGKVRVINRKTGMFLHWSGQGETGDVNYSYLGWRRQVRNLGVCLEVYKTERSSMIAPSP